MDISSIGNSNANVAVVLNRQASSDASISTAQAATPTITETAVSQPNKSPSLADVTKAVQDINKSIQSSSQGVEFTVDNDDKRVVVKVVDQQTKQVLRQIPTEEAIEISKSLDKLQGLLIKQQA
ncbi:flagellar protein FlaG [Undibacterium sp. Rencai35W]|uniref:flagellar protein FlaG n=1 Tax=Undibacterium sp. Rencai35W TaxID=3413046 RepID=UPI003BF3C691